MSGSQMFFLKNYHLQFSPLSVCFWLSEQVWNDINSYNHLKTNSTTGHGTRDTGYLCLSGEFKEKFINYELLNSAQPQTSLYMQYNCETKRFPCCFLVLRQRTTDIASTSITIPRWREKPQTAEGFEASLWSKLTIKTLPNQSRNMSQKFFFQIGTPSPSGIDERFSFL